jgi:hypothetical protein
LLLRVELLLPERLLPLPLVRLPRAAVQVLVRVRALLLLLLLLLLPRILVAYLVVPANSPRVKVDKENKDWHSVTEHKEPPPEKKNTHFYFLKIRQGALY